MNMNKKNRILISLIKVMGLLIIFACSCKKDDKEEQRTIPKPVFGTVTDIDGNVYKTVVIGRQEWMAENLKTTRFNDGTPIPLATNPNSWITFSPLFGWYKNDENLYKNTYGALYNWFAVDTLNICPQGWHVPSDSEWKELEYYLLLRDYMYGYADTLVAKDLAADKLWELSTGKNAIGNNLSLNNSTGFNALPGGCIIGTEFGGIGNQACWWTSTSYSPLNGVMYELGNVYPTLSFVPYTKWNGYSIRCVEDLNYRFSAN
jgi:uncharacterized protein (TIGR02145 family)